MSKLTIQLVTWNGEKYIPHLFASLKKQTFHDWQLVVFDNASTDETVQYIKNECDEGFPVSVEIIEYDKNIGFAGGHNQLFRQHTKASKNTYTLLLNQDMFLAPECLERMVRFLDTHLDVGAVGPRLMAWKFNQTQNNTFNMQHSFSDRIDSLGIRVFRSRRVVEWHTGEQWSDIKDQFSDTAAAVFGVSGALPMYRNTALRSVAFLDGNIFDPSYHSYKEDVDLAFRLRSAGYKVYTLLNAVAYHDRSAAGPQSTSDRAAAQNKANQSIRVQYQSYKNHLATIYKNSYWQSTLLDFPWIFWYELKKFLYYLFIHPSVLKGLVDLWRIRKDLRRRKDQISAKRKIGWREMWTYIGKK